MSGNEIEGKKRTQIKNVHGQIGLVFKARNLSHET